jgi:DNA-binding NarL/FixJ family response regulator
MDTNGEKLVRNWAKRGDLREMTKDCASALSALIVAKPGPLRDGLRALMIAMPQIGAVDEVNDFSSALKMVFEHRPTLVLLDVGLISGDTWMTIRQAKARWPKARCILLADDVQQHQEAEAAGADAVLLKGFPAARLVATMVRLLPKQLS